MALCSCELGVLPPGRKGVNAENFSRSDSSPQLRGAAIRNFAVKENCGLALAAATCAAFATAHGGQVTVLPTKQLGLLPQAKVATDDYKDEDEGE